MAWLGRGLSVPQDHLPCSLESDVPGESHGWLHWGKAGKTLSRGPGALALALGGAWWRRRWERPQHLPPTELQQVWGATWVQPSGCEGVASEGRGGSGAQRKEPTATTCAASARLLWAAWAPLSGGAAGWAGGALQDLLEVAGDSGQVGAFPEDFAAAGAAVEMLQPGPPQHARWDARQLQPGAIGQRGWHAGLQVRVLQPTARGVIGAALGGLLQG